MECVVVTFFLLAAVLTPVDKRRRTCNIAQHELGMPLVTLIQAKLQGKGEARMIGGKDSFYCM